MTGVVFLFLFNKKSNMQGGIDPINEVVSEVFIYKKLDDINISIVDFDSSTVKEAFAYVYQASTERDLSNDSETKGLCCEGWRSPIEDLVKNPNEQLGNKNTPKDTALRLELTDEILNFEITVSAINISLIDLIIKIAVEAKLDIYLTSLAVVVVPENTKPQLKLDLDEKVWKVIKVKQ